MKKSKWIAMFIALYMTAIIAFTGCDNNAGGKTPSTPPPPAPQSMTLAEAIAAIKAIPATFDASRDEPLQIVFAGDVSYTQEESTAFYNAMKDAPNGSVAIDMSQANMTEIPDYMFAYCNSLASVILPNSVTSIGIEAFMACPLLKINVDSGNAKYSSENGVLYNKNKTEIIAWPGASGNLTIPSNVSIANYAFAGCFGLTSVTIPSNVTSIGDLDHSSMFYVCRNLISVYIPASVTIIGSLAFGYCDSLTNINYAGTKDDWNTRITFGREWKICIPTTTGVTCTDGTYKFVGSSSNAADSKLGDPI